MEIEILKSDVVQSITAAEVDMQIATAKKYPREISVVLKRIEQLATLDTETAEDCFYALKRGKGDDAKTIEGLSVRFAEIMANNWGNLRIATRVVGNDGKNVTVQGICHDLETNVAISIEVKRRITDKYGKTYNEDMQTISAMAGSAIAFRNAVLKVIPKAITKRIVENVKQVALGKTVELEKSRTKCIEAFDKIGVKEVEILTHLEISTIEEIDKEKLFYLRGLWNAIKEGSQSVDSVFRKTHGTNPIDELKQKVSDLIDLTTDKHKKAKLIHEVIEAETSGKNTVEFYHSIIEKIENGND